MASYINQLIPSLGQTTESIEPPPHEDEIDPVKLTYLTIFNPSFIDPKEEDEHELIKQIVCFISDENVVSNLDQLKIIGLLRGTVLLGQEFADDLQTPTIIQASTSSIIVVNIELDFFIACAINLSDDADKYGYINNQLVKLVQQAYSRFVMLNRSFNVNYVADKNRLIDYWKGFYTRFNAENFTSPINWPNSLNYRGFLGLLPKNNYKRSSLTFGSNTKDEIDKILQLNNEYLPKGIVISYFNKLSSKKYGLVYKRSSSIQDNSLIDVYNWLEFQDYHNKLSTFHLTSEDIDKLFESNIAQPRQPEPQTSATASATAAAMDLLNPMNITNNLIVLPLNYTVNGMISLHGKFINNEHIETERAPDQPQAEASSWLSIPPILKQFRLGGYDEPPEVEGDIEQEIPGEYLIGLKIENNQKVIHKKYVYFDDKLYSLVIYGKDDIYITLIFESGVDQLDNNQFYINLQQDILDPSIEEITSTCINASINGSLGSLKSLNKFMPTPLDSDFFFVIYDVEEGWYKSSLPYLPTDSTMKLHNAMIYLHDQLPGLFIIKNNRDFFSGNNLMNEYFHKFTSNKLNDWMFYYIRHDSKTILIIKNLNKNHIKSGKKVLPEDAGFISRFTEGVHLGFLDNLGDDVKNWLDVFSSNGEI